MAGGARSVMFERLIKVPLENDDSAAKFAISNAAKDLRYYTNMAGEPCRLLLHRRSGASDLCDGRSVRGYGDKFVPRIIDLLCEINGVKLPGK